MRKLFKDLQNYLVHVVSFEFDMETNLNEIS